MPAPQRIEAAPKVKRGFDYSRFDNIDISDDEETFHPNIEKSFNIKINRHVRDRDEREADVEIARLSKIGTAEAQEKARIIESKKKLHVGNMGAVADEKTIVNHYRPDIVSRDGLESDADVERYQKFVEEHQRLLSDFVKSGGNHDVAEDLLARHGEILLMNGFTATYLMLTCLEKELAGDQNGMYQCAQQSQLLAHITELAKSMNRPPRDLVSRWFDRVRDAPEAEKVWVEDVDRFAGNVRDRAVQKRKEQEEEAKRKREAERKWVAAHALKSREKGAADADVPDVADLPAAATTGGKKYVVDGEEFDESELQAVPLVEAMHDMTKEQRMGPGGLDPVEVFEQLPKSMQNAFKSQQIEDLVAVSQSMPPLEFNMYMDQCAKAGLWTQPGGDDGDEESDIDDEEGEFDEGSGADSAGEPSGEPAAKEEAAKDEAAKGEAAKEE